jgi:hypothetical protein
MIEEEKRKYGVFGNLTNGIKAGTAKYFERIKPFYVVRN